MLGQSGFMICLGCFKSHHNGLFSVGHGQTDTILGGDGHQSLLYFKSPSRVAGADRISILSSKGGNKITGTLGSDNERNYIYGSLNKIMTNSIVNRDICRRGDVKPIVNCDKCNNFPLTYLPRCRSSEWAR